MVEGQIPIEEYQTGNTTHSINIKKLQSRFPNKFTAENALERNLEKEHKILENEQS